MRVIKIELPATLKAVDPTISLESAEIRAQLFQELSALDYEISELVRQRATSYFPPSYSVFVRTYLSPVETRITPVLWIVDPTVQWPRGLLARSAWRLFVPVCAHVVQETIQTRVPQIAVDIDEKQADIVVLAPTRGWRDPVILSIGVAVLTSLYWVLLHPMFARVFKSLLGL